IPMIRAMVSTYFLSGEHRPYCRDRVGDFAGRLRIDAATMAYYRQWLRGPYEWLEELLSQRDWLVGDGFSVADAYAFVAVRQAISLAINLNDLQAVDAFRRKVQMRPSVQAIEGSTIDSLLPKILNSLNQISL
ncbi:glutathione S-transferase family protein, partial [Pseudomonas sp. CDFA 602]|uniref:glutathione S-transferase family protein n=1 Tax=Pseudomonas californiensis TaxID=2829823 RepID=UPI001E60E682